MVDEFAKFRKCETVARACVNRATVMATCVVVILASVTRVRSQGSQSSTITIPIPAFVAPACNDELVAFSDGVFVQIDRINLDSSGGYHIKDQIKVQGSGVGTITGYNYRLYMISNSEDEFTNPPGAYSHTITTSNQMTGQHPENNLLISVTTKLTTNNLGVVTVDFVRTKFECPADGPSFP